MTKNFIPTCKIKLSFLVFILLFISCIPASFAQCCMKVTTTKTCKDKNTGTAVAIPCTPGSFTYNWDDASAQTDAVAVNLSAGVYHLRITNKNLSCTDTLTVTIVDSSCTPFSIPNIMTPNGDGKNDEFVITGLQHGSQLMIFNRWGALVYNSNNYNNDWNGNGMTDGVYYYILNPPATELNDKLSIRKGFVHILTN